MTDKEVQMLVELFARESSENRAMAKTLLDQNTDSMRRLVDVMVDRRLCKLDAAQEALTRDGTPRYSDQPCMRTPDRTDFCTTHNQDVWACVKEMTEWLT